MNDQTNGTSLPIETQNTPVAFSNDPAAIAAAEQARAQIQTAYLVAMQKPRDVMEARRRILEACKRPKFAGQAKYAKPVGGRKIIGPSVRFAEEAIRAWRNVLTASQVVYEDDEIKRVRVTAIDLEANVGYTHDVQVSKTVERRSPKDREVVGKRTNSNGDVVYVVKATEDELHNKIESGVSKSIRNSGLRLVPADIVEEAMEEVDKTLRSADAADPQGQLKKICDAFSVIGVKPKHISEYLGHSLDDPITPADLQSLRGVFTAINSGETTWAAVMTDLRGGKLVDADGGTSSLKERVGAVDPSPEDVVEADGDE